MKFEHRILIVDDNKINTTVLKDLLEENYFVKIAYSGEQALDIITQFRPDLVLLDIMMPGIDGFETCKRIRSTPNLNRAKIIMVSGKGFVSERVKGYEVGADDYIVKPFEVEELLAKVRVYLRLKSVEEVDDLKGNLLTFLHHETNTPLNGILVPVETLLDDEDMDAASRRKWLQMNYRSALRLKSLLEKAMTLCAMKSGQLDFNFEIADLCSVIRDAIIKVESKAKKRNVSIELKLPNTAMTMLDRVQMTRVVTILLDNAIRFSPEGKCVNVQISLEKEYYCLKVQDHGKGIHADFLPHIFEEFSDPDFKYHTEGHGLSLAIARQILLKHKGLHEAESTIGAGATFTAKLPVYTPSNPQNINDPSLL